MYILRIIVVAGDFSALRSFFGKGGSGPDTGFDGQVQPGQEAVGAGGAFIWVDSLAG